MSTLGWPLFSAWVSLLQPSWGSEHDPAPLSCSSWEGLGPCQLSYLHYTLPLPSSLSLAGWGGKGSSTPPGMPPMAGRVPQPCFSPIMTCYVPPALLQEGDGGVSGLSRLAPVEV